MKINSGNVIFCVIKKESGIPEKNAALMIKMNFCLGSQKLLKNVA